MYIRIVLFFFIFADNNFEYVASIFCFVFCNNYSSSITTDLIVEAHRTDQNEYNSLLDSNPRLQ